jgi:outer membrane protein OmpA-like peptidoglycan-associated protein
MDGKALLLAFAEKKNSDRDDIYVSLLGASGWSRPENLGDGINTEFSETTPYLAADGRTMYFSSDRPGGQGSHDIYLTKRLGNGWSSWRKPVNIGPPVNTSTYDAYYTLAAKGDYAYFLSSTESGKKDIFRIAIEQEPEPAAVDAAEAKPILQQDVKSSPRITSSESSEAVVLLSGKVSDATGKVPTGASVSYEDLKTGKIIGQATPDPGSGQYKLVLPYGTNYGITAKADGFLPSSLHLDLSQMRGRYLELDGRDLSFVPIAKGSTVTVNNLFFELNKATLTPESEPELKRMVQVMLDNVALRIEISGHTDNTGTDAINNALSQARADAVKTYLLTAGIPAARIQSKGYGSKKPKATNETEEGRAQNRRVEFSIL